MIPIHNRWTLQPIDINNCKIRGCEEFRPDSCHCVEDINGLQWLGLPCSVILNTRNLYPFPDSECDCTEFSLTGPFFAVCGDWTPRYEICIPYWSSFMSPQDLIRTAFLWAIQISLIRQMHCSACKIKPTPPHKHYKILLYIRRTVSGLGSLTFSKTFNSWLALLWEGRPP